MSPDHITAGAYNQDIDKWLARVWSGYVRLIIIVFAIFSWDIQGGYCSVFQSSPLYNENKKLYCFRTQSLSLIFCIHRKARR